MKLPRLWLMFPLLLSFSWSLQTALAQPAKATSRVEATGKSIAKEDALQRYLRRSLAFEINEGQTNQRVKFLSRNEGYNLFITAREAVLQLRSDQIQRPRKQSWEAEKRNVERRHNSPAAILRLQFLHANPTPVIRGLEPLPGHHNYYLGKDRRRWQTEVNAFAKVEHKDIYPGIDLLWYGNQQQLEYDFALRPGANAKDIQLGFSGAQKMLVDANGDLVLTTPQGEVRQRKPIAYQEQAGQRRYIEVRYEVARQQRVQFAVGNYDRSLPLVIDPILLYSSFFGGNGTGFANNPGTDYAYDATIDDEGNLYITGTTASVDFPVVQPVQASINSIDGCCEDAFVTKLSPSGIVFSTYLGGSIVESGNAITLDKDGNVIITGQTTSPNFPTTPGAISVYASSVPQAFATKLDRNGRLVFSTYLGGLGRNYGDAVTTDSNGNIYVAGTTRAYDFPVVNAYQSNKSPGRNYDAFITKLDPLGTGIIYSTFLGGEGDEGINAIKVDQAGNMYITGATTSFDYPVSNAIQDYWAYDYNANKGGRLPDVFLTKLSANGQSLIYSTYIGNFDIDYATDMEIDSLGNAYLTGYSAKGLAGETSYPASSLSPTRQALVRTIPDANLFVLKLDVSGTKPLFINYFGAEDNPFSGPALALDTSGLIYVAGGLYRVARVPFTITADAFQPQAPSNNNGTAFLSIFDPARQGAAALRYSTLLSGSGSDGASAVLLDKQNNVYLIGYSTYDPLRGGTNDFPILNAPYKSTFGAATDIFIAKFSSLFSPPGSGGDVTPPTISITAPTTGSEFTTTTPRITIRGTASDNVGVKVITATLGENLSRNITGTSNWSIPDLYLQQGKNKITVTAADAAGNTQSATLTITYQAEYLIETYAGHPYTLAPDNFTGDDGPARIAKFHDPLTLAVDKSGNLIVGDRTGSRLRKIASNGLITHFAGGGISGFTGDGGPAKNALFGGTGTMAIDRNGNLYLADPWNHRVRKISPEGIITTVAGSGPVCPQDCEGQHSGDGGPATQARLKGPSLVAVDSAGNLYIADITAHRIRKVNSAGVITTIAGKETRGNTGDGGLAVNAEIEELTALIVDAQDNLYFSQAGGDGGHVIRKITTDGKINRIAGTGKASYGDESGPALSTDLSVRSMALDGAGNLYFVDLLAHRVRRINASGYLDTLAGRGESVAFRPGDGGAASAAYFKSPYSIAVDAKGIIYVLEASGQSIRRLIPTNLSDAAAPVVTVTTPSASSLMTSIPMISLRGHATDNNGIFQVKWNNDRGGSGSAMGLDAWQVDNIALQAGLNTITITAIDAAGNAGTRQIVVEYQPDTSPPVISIISPTTSATYNTDSVLLNLRGTSSDNASVADIQWRTDRGDYGYATGTAAAWRIDKLVVREGVTNVKVTALDYAGNANSTTLAINYRPEYLMYSYAGGNFNLNYDRDGVSASQARFLDPQGMARDKFGNIYVSDGQFNTIRKISPNGFVSIFKEMSYPGPLATDAQGNLYVLNPISYRVFKITPNGQVSDFAGTGNFVAPDENVPALSSSLGGTSSMKFDAAGNLYLTNYLTHRIYKINAQTGIINAVVGKGSQGYSGDGGAALNAQLSNPIGITFDRQGNLYFADQNRLIRRVGTDGIIRTIAGVPNVQGFGGDGGPALAAQFNNPLDLAIDEAGNLFLADAANSCIRRIKPDGTVSTIAGISPFLPEQFTEFARGEYNAALWGTIVLPWALALDGQGTIYVLDKNLARVRAITPFALNTLPVTSVSGASYAQAPVASEAIVSAFGTNLASGEWPATQLPLPFSLGGTFVKVKDSQGVERPAPLFYVSPLQVNYQIPKGTAPGLATVTITSGNGNISTGSTQITSLAPGLFTATADGKGWAAADVQRVKADGSQVYEPVTRFDPAQNKVVALPIDVSNPQEQVYLLLYGTGLRGRSSLPNVRVTIGGIPCEVLYAGAQGAYVGLDQMNIKLPRSLVGRQEVEVALIIDGKPANVVQVHIK